MKEWQFNTEGGGRFQIFLECWILFGPRREDQILFRTEVGLKFVHASLANVLNKWYKKVPCIVSNRQLYTSYN